MGCKCAKERTLKLETAQSRRNHLASHPLIVKQREKIPNSIEVIREYVDTGKGHMISTSCFRPKSFDDTKLKGMVFYCQGYGAYTDWTDTDSAINFVKRGYIFITHDHYGQGRSDGNWLTNPTDSFDTYVDDAHYIFERAKRKFTPKYYIQNNKKCHNFLFGHSLGGAICIELSKRYTGSAYHLKVKDINIDEKSQLKLDKTGGNDYIPNALFHHHNDDIAIYANNALFGWDGMILSAPMVKIKIAPPDWLIKIAKYLVPLFPEARLVPTKNLADKLTTDKEYFEFVKQSPLMYEDKPALRTGFILLEFTKHIEKEIEKVRLPLLIMHGEKDEITDPEMSQMFYDRCACASKDKTIKIFKGALHALLLEKCRNEVIDEVDQWISQRIKVRR